uniref:Uncharacterized protein n=1 Tax=Arundo donax TaxID=35708 RepID=A0A0A9H061_ARUDO
MRALAATGNDATYLYFDQLLCGGLVSEPMFPFALMLYSGNVRSGFLSRCTQAVTRGAR